MPLHRRLNLGLATATLLVALLAPLRASTSVTFVRLERAVSCRELLVANPYSAQTAAAPPPADPSASPSAWSGFVQGVIELKDIECFGDDASHLRAVEQLVRAEASSLVVGGAKDAATLSVLPEVGGRHNGEDVALELVRAGLARAAAAAPQSFHDAEADARQKARGHWAAGHS